MAYPYPTKRPCTVADVEQALFDAYPRAWAESWDRVGLTVGDPKANVTAVAFALDATPASVRAAQDVGANVLVAHHPVCLEMPRSIRPHEGGGTLPAACIWEAVSRGVAVISMHTNLDRSADATAQLPALLGLEARCGIERGRSVEEGRLGSIARLEVPEALDAFAERCRAAYGRVAQVYGDPVQSIERTAFFTGSLGDSGKNALAEHADVVVCGECGYHRALDLIDRGCAVIILGHDASELPLVDVLQRRLVSWGLPAERCIKLDEAPAWH